MASALDKLIVVIDGGVVGHLIVKESTGRMVAGQFVPGPEFDRHRLIFDEALALATQFDELAALGECDYSLWDRWANACQEIGRLLPSFAEVTDRTIDAFEVYPNWQVQVFLIRQFD